MARAAEPVGLGLADRLIRITSLKAAMDRVERLEQVLRDSGPQLSEDARSLLQVEIESDLGRVTGNVPWLLETIHQLNSDGTFDSTVDRGLREASDDVVADKLAAAGGPEQFARERLRPHTQEPLRMLKSDDACGKAIIVFLIVCTICVMPGGQAVCPACVAAGAAAVANCL